MLQKVLNDLVKFEGLSKKIYQCPAGKLTIGYGRNLEDNGVSKKEAELMLLFDIDNIINQLDRKVNFWKMQPVNARIVLVQMAFQLGIGGLLQFKKFLTALQKNDLVTAKKEMFDSKWAKQTPNRVQYLAEYLDQMNEPDDKKIWNKDINRLKNFLYNLL